MDKQELDKYYETQEINNTKLFLDIKELDKNIDMFYSIFLSDKIKQINNTNEKNSKLEIYASNDINKTPITNSLQEIESKIKEQYIKNENQEILKYHALTKLLNHLEKLDILHCTREDIELLSSLKKEISTILISLQDQISYEIKGAYEEIINQ